MISKQKQKMQIIVTQIKFGEEVSGGRNSNSQGPIPNVGRKNILGIFELALNGWNR